MADKLKIAIPMAGWGTRMRPHTWSKPKPLVGVAGKASLDHLMDMFKSLPDPSDAEYIFIVGPYLGEQQIPPYIKKNYPGLMAHYVVQTEMKGQSHALWLARRHLRGPMLMVFSDTLIETNFSFLADEACDGVAWVKPVPDPRRFGVAEVDQKGWVTRLIEKPQTMTNNMVVVGCYYFKSGEALVAAIEEQMQRDIALKGEYFLADAVNIMLERGARFRIEKVEVWLDTGTVEATLETNRYLLERLQVGRLEGLQVGRLEGSQVGKLEPSNLSISQPANVKVVSPVFIHESAKIENSIIGPYASIGAHCVITRSRIENSILEEGGQVTDAALSGSIIGRQAKVQGRGADDRPMALNIGDNSSVVL